MSININYLNRANSNSSGNLVFFTDEKFNINGLKRYLANSDFYYINDLLKANDLKTKNNENQNTKNETNQENQRKNEKRN